MARVVLSPGDIFAGYTVEGVLGVGGMGTVYRALDPELPRSVALKLLHRELTSDDYVRAHFELEAAHAARLSHPNIVVVHRRGQVDDQLWIAMEYVDTIDAAEAVAQGPLDPGHVVHVAAETAKALDFAHAARVLHRDVKPANILLERARPGLPGRVLLTDFGIAKALADSMHLTKTGMVALSLQYASPEQFDPHIDLDARTDVYSLGCTVFHLLTGQVPYPGTTLPQLYAGHLTSPIPSPRALRPDLPASFDAVIAQALAKDREDRYATCGQLAAAAKRAISAPRPDTVRLSSADLAGSRNVAKPASPTRSLETQHATSSAIRPGITIPRFEAQNQRQPKSVARRRQQRSPSMWLPSPVLIAAFLALAATIVLLVTVDRWVR